MRIALTFETPYFEVRKNLGSMPSATSTTKSQITIPVQVRNDLKVDSDDRIEFVLVAPGRYELVTSTRSVRELKGMFVKPSKTVSIAHACCVPHRLSFHG
jgi:antitoxin PrlF